MPFDLVVCTSLGRVPASWAQLLQKQCVAAAVWSVDPWIEPPFDSFHGNQQQQTDEPSQEEHGRSFFLLQLQQPDLDHKQATPRRQTDALHHHT